MPTSELDCLTAWSRLGHKGHRIAFLEVRGKVRQGAARSKSDGLGWVPVFLNGSGPVGVLIRQQPRQQRERAISRQAFLEVALAEARVAGLPDADYTVATPEELKEKELPYLLELLQATYAVYKNTWNGLYKEPSPLFLRAVFRKVFRPLGLTLIEDPGKPSEFCPHLPAGFSPAYLVSLIGRLPMERRLDAAEYINRELADQIEAEVLKLEAGAPSRSKESLPGLPLRSPDDSSPVQLVAKSKEGQVRKRKRDPRVAKRDELIVTLRDVTYAGLTGINRDKKIADTLAEQQDIFPPRHWGIQSFKDAPRQKPQELHQMISKAHV